MTAERDRLAESAADSAPWRLWGPYVSARQWGTVREDYSASGDAWSSFPFDHAHKRAYRWGEDGLGGWCDRYGFLTLTLALWNGQDDRVKERPFGLTNPQGNHGEDVKEYWWPLDCTPTASFSRWLYRYPQRAFPYADLVAENGRRSRNDPEYELADTGALDEDRFFDVELTHAKATPTDLCLRITATNQGPDPAPLHLAPQLTFRNTWAWGRDDRVPELSVAATAPGTAAIAASHAALGRYVVYAKGGPRLLFCDNETNTADLYGHDGRSPHPKDAIDRAIRGDSSLVNPAEIGTRAAFWFDLGTVAPGASVTVDVRLTDQASRDPFGADFERALTQRAHEADEFYADAIPADVDADDRATARAAFAGLQWGKQVYRYDVTQWLDGDPAGPPPPHGRGAIRNGHWENLSLADVISMPDDWEYPWFASWDLAFHCVALAHVDPAFAKNQLILLCREWAMHPDGQLPAYEWEFSDVNPPVHAWAAWQVYVVDGRRDTDFLARVYVKLLLNFAWWVNRKDSDGSNLFEGGFLGMDNIGLFDRSKGFDGSHRLEQSDATSWMAFYCLTMMRIALELGRSNRVWDDLATKFLEHFLDIAQAIESADAERGGLWDEDDGFFYDLLIGDDGSRVPLKIHSMVGLLPLLAVINAPTWALQLPDLSAHLTWLREHEPKRLVSLITSRDEQMTLAILDPDRYRRVLTRMLDENEFLSPHGIRALSAVYRTPLVMSVAGQEFRLAYEPGESDSAMFGGNSNWRGPVWFPVNVLLADALRTFSRGAAGDLVVECPTGSGRHLPLDQVADELDDRLIGLFRPNPDGRRPGAPRDHGSGPLWDHPTFSEYFHGDTGVGLGASHQTGWTAIVAHLICLDKTNHLKD